MVGKYAYSSQGRRHKGVTKRQLCPSDLGAERERRRGQASAPVPRSLSHLAHLSLRRICDLAQAIYPRC
jgi:hypothetical protein